MGRKKGREEENREVKWRGKKGKEKKKVGRGERKERKKEEEAFQLDTASLWQSV